MRLFCVVCVFSFLDGVFHALCVVVLLGCCMKQHKSTHIVLFVVVACVFVVCCLGVLCMFGVVVCLVLFCFCLYVLCCFCVFMDM